MTIAVIVAGVLHPPRYDGISFVWGGCNTPLTNEIQLIAGAGVCSCAHENSPLQEFAPATTEIPTWIPNRNLIVAGVLHPPRNDGISFVWGGCNTPLTNEIQLIAVAGVCSCDHGSSNLESHLEFRWVYSWLQEQTPAAAHIQLT